jgi:hypothetical protein
MPSSRVFAHGWSKPKASEGALIEHEFRLPLEILDFQPWYLRTQLDVVR